MAFISSRWSLEDSIEYKLPFWSSYTINILRQNTKAQNQTGFDGRAAHPYLLLNPWLDNSSMEWMASKDKYYWTYWH